MNAMAETQAIDRAAQVIREACLNAPNPIWLRDEHWRNVARKVQAALESEKP